MKKSITVDAQFISDIKNTIGMRGCPKLSAEKTAIVALYKRHNIEYTDSNINATLVSVARAEIKKAKSASNIRWDFFTNDGSLQHVSFTQTDKNKTLSHFRKRFNKIRIIKHEIEINPPYSDAITIEEIIFK